MPSLKRHIAWGYTGSAARHKGLFWLPHPHSPRGPVRRRDLFNFQKSQLFLTRPFFGQNRQVKKGGNVGTPPSGKHVAHISQWHMARDISWTIIIRIPLRIRVMQFSYPDRLKERQMTFQLLLSKEEQTSLAEHRHPDNLHNASAPQYIRVISMCHPGIIVRIIN